MDEKIIELVARAICASRGVDPDGDWRATQYPGGARLMLDFHDEQPQQWRRHAKEARAAIEAYEKAIAEAGFVIVPVATTSQPKEFNAEVAETEKWIADLEEDIRRGARRSPRRFKL